MSFVFGCGEKKNDKKIIGVLQYTDNNLTTLEGFKKGLSMKGFKEGENLEIIFHGSVDKISSLQTELSKILEKKPDLIFTSTTPAAIAAYKGTKKNKIPVVFAPVNDPLSAGIVADLKYPGGNITGIRLSRSDNKRLEWIKRLRPETRVVMIPFNPNDKSPKATLKTIQSAAEKLEIKILEYPVNNNDEIDYSLKNIPENVDAVFLPRDGLVMSRFMDYSKVCIEKNIVLSTPRYIQVKQGALTGYGFIGFEIGQQAARLASSILKGAKAGDLPVETAEDYLFLNLESAGKMKFEIDVSIIKQAYKNGK